MRNRILYYSIFILFGVSTSLNAQRLHELTPYSFYQEWSLISKDYSKNLLIYTPIENLKSVKSNSSNSILKFKRRSRTFYSRNSKQVKEKRPLNWSNAPKKVTRKKGRCGNEFIGKRNKVENHNIVERYSRKGVWKVYSKNDTRFLVLKHLLSVNNEGYILEKEEEFQIVSLEEDKMELRKVNVHEDGL